MVMQKSNYSSAESQINQLVSPHKYLHVSSMPLLCYGFKAFLYAASKGSSLFHGSVVLVVVVYDILCTLCIGNGSAQSVRMSGSKL